MSNMQVRTGGGALAEIKARGAGSQADPYVMEHDSVADLQLGAQSLTLTLAGDGTASAPIPDDDTLVGVYTSNDMRLGLEAPEADGTATGAAVAGDFNKGIPAITGQWTWYKIGTGTSRRVYFLGTAAHTVKVVTM